MADDIAVLGIQVDSRQVKKADGDLDRLAKTSTKTAKATDGLNGSTKKASATQAIYSKTTVRSAKATDALGIATTTTTSATSGMTRAVKAATAAMLTYIGARAAGALKGYADDFTSIENKLKQVTKSTAELNSITEKLFEVSNRTRSGITDTVVLFQRLTMASGELNLSQDEVLRLSETINKSFKIYGATAAEAAGATRQLSQGLAAGALRGDEFNSVSEQAPIIMQAIVKQTGLSIGALREFAATGGITAKIVIAALKGIESEVDGKYAKSIATFQDKTLLAANAMIEFAGRSEGLKSAVDAAGDALLLGAEALAFFLENLGLVTALIVARSVPALLALAVAHRSYATAAGLATIATKGFSAALAVLGGPVGVLLTAAVALGAWILSMDTAEEKAASLREEISKLNNGFVDLSIDQLAVESRLLQKELDNTERTIKDLTESMDLLSMTAAGSAAPSISAATSATVDLENHSEKLRVKLSLVNAQLFKLRTTADKTTPAIVKTTKAISALNRQLAIEGAQILSAVQDQIKAAEELAIVNEEAAQEQIRVTEELALANKKATDEMQKNWLKTRDFVADVFVDIAENGKSAFSNLLNAFKTMIIRMVAVAAANRVLIGVGFGGASGAASAAGGAGDLLSGGGALLSLAGSGVGQAIGAAGGAIPLAAGAFGAISGFKQSGVKGAIAGGAGGFGGAQLGAAIGTAILPGIGTIVGAFLGGLIGGKLGASLFGGATKTTGAGIAVGAEEGTLASRQFRETEKKRSFFRGTRRETIFSELEQSVGDALSETFEGIKTIAKNNFDALGIDIENSIIDSFSFGETRLRFGKNEEKNRTIIEEFFTGIAEDMVQLVQGENALSFTRLGELASAIQSVNSIMEQLGKTMFDASVSGAEAAERLIAAAGGIEALNIATGRFFDLFVETRSAFEILSDGLDEALTSIGEALPNARQGFADLVKGLDVTTDSGRSAFVMLTNLAVQADAYYAGLERLEEQRSENLLSLSRLATDVALEALKESITEQMRDVDISVRMVTGSVRALTSLSSTLDSVIANMTGSSRASRIGARQAAQSALSSALSGGSLAEADLRGPLREIAKPSEDLFGSFTDYLRDSQLTNNLLQDLRDETVTQLTTEEQSLIVLEDQRGLLQAQLDAAVELVALMRGTANAVGDPFDNFNRSVTDEKSGGLIGQVEQLYQSVLGRSSDEGGLAFWVNELKTGVTDISAVRTAFETSAEARGFPSFASGGNHSGGVRLVGERGPELEFTGPSRIVSNGDMMAAMSGGGIKAELQQLRSEMKQALFAVARNTMQSAKLLDRWDGDGQPPIRTV